MITPFGKLEELRVNSESSYRCLELSPNGLLFAAATVDSVELWSACGEVILLARCHHQRPSGYSKALLKRVFLVWSKDSSSFAVIWSEGNVNYYSVSYRTTSLEDVYSGQEDPINLPRASMKVEYMISIEQFGYPISVCAYEGRILVATDNGVLCELNWKGDSVGRTLNRFLGVSSGDSSISKEDQKIISLSACSELHCLAIALNSNSCCLVDVSDLRHPVKSCDFHTDSSHDIRQVCFCPGLPLLAVMSTSLTVTIYQVTRKEQDSYSLRCHPIALIDVRQLPRTQISPLHSYDSIVSLTWCPSQPILAIGLHYQGLVVWSLHTGVIFTYTSSQEGSPFDEVKTPGGSECVGVASSTEISCCAFSSSGSHLLFNIPFEQIINPENSQPYTRASQLLLQSFFVSSDHVSATYVS